ncbi:MAG: hypothetical protein QXU73_05730 [Thermoplasmata archaeon]
MPRGYGVGRGSYWWHHHRPFCWPTATAGPAAETDLKKGLVYVGPCRCGHGPHAYYRTADGRIVRASTLPFPGQASVAPERNGELSEDELKAELQRLRERVLELEKKLAERPRAARE